MQDRGLCAHSLCVERLHDVSVVDDVNMVNGHDIDLIDRRSLEQLGHFQPLNLSRVPPPPLPVLLAR